jgi:hypothetical protein
MKRFMRLGLAVVAISMAICSVTAQAADDRLVVHEWGTFTALQDDTGRSLTGINIDDEPVPKFVHNLAPFLHNHAVLSNHHWEYRMKGAPRRHPQVALRLETPVIYFYPPKDQVTPFLLNVNVQFRGGWLTEFYPDAKATVPGMNNRGFDFGQLNSDTVGQLAWNDLKVGTSADGPKTDEHVWVAPRKVDAVPVTTPKGESEKYLFYRGVGNQQAPLRLVQGKSRGKAEVYSNFEGVIPRDKSVPMRHVWLVDVTAKNVYFKSIPSFDAFGDPNRRATEISLDFHKSEEGLDSLKAQMHAALTQEGLYSDEATAMLETWNRAYFKSPGMRLFFTVPREWTDYYLPLSLSQPADVSRVMVARIELITHEQRALLDKLRVTANSTSKWIEEMPESDAKQRFLAGRSDYGDLGKSVPPDYQMYLALGRFRNALVLAEERRNPSQNLTKFINTYGLHPFRVPEAKKPENAGGSAPTGTTGG